MSINVCGYETLKKKQTEDISSIYNIDEGEGKIALIEGDKWF